MCIMFPFEKYDVEKALSVPSNNDRKGLNKTQAVFS